MWGRPTGIVKMNVTHKVQKSWAICEKVEDGRKIVGK
jgi:hypothetical protein